MVKSPKELDRGQLASSVDNRLNPREGSVPFQVSNHLSLKDVAAATN
jgi:hypothetical protein